MLTRQQLYELYHSGFERMLHFVEQLLSHLGDVERHVGHRQQYTIDRLLKDFGQLAKRVERLKAQLLKQEMVNDQLTRRVQELQTELARRGEPGSAAAPAAVRRDSHNSGLPPSLDLPGVKAASAVKRTCSLRRKSAQRVGVQVGHVGATLRQVDYPDRLRVHTPRACRRCRASLIECAVVGRKRQQVFDLPPVALEVTAHWAQTKRCAGCGVRTTARFPQAVKAPVQYGQRVCAVATYLHKYQLLREPSAKKFGFNCLPKAHVFPNTGPAISSRPLSVPLFKRLTERRLTFVPDEEGYLGGCQSVFQDHLNGLVHSPA